MSEAAVPTESPTAPITDERLSSTDWIATIRSGPIVLRAAAAVTTTDLDEELILYNPVDGATHALNVTAALIWDMCDGNHTFDDVVTELATDFAVPSLDVERDVSAVLEQFYRLALLADTGPSPSDI